MSSRKGLKTHISNCINFNTGVCSVGLSRGKARMLRHKNSGPILVFEAGPTRSCSTVTLAGLAKTKAHLLFLIYYLTSQLVL